MSFFQNIFTKLAEAEEKLRIKKEKKALALKELRSKSIPIIKSVIEPYGASVAIEFLDTDAYIFVTNNGKERGIYIPYGTLEETISTKVDKLVNNFESAAKHKLRTALGKGADIAFKIEDGYEHLDDDIRSLDSRTGKKNFWDNPPSLSDLDTSLNKKRR